MENFNQEKFNQFVLENNVIGLFEKPIILKSGRKSNWYVNWRTLCADAYLINQLSDFILQFVTAKSISFDCFFGVPEGATKIGVISQLKWAKSQPSFQKGSHIVPMGRAIPKEHGDPKDRFFLGEPQGRIIVLEDVTTTGLSLFKTLDQLESQNKEIAAVICFTNRVEPRNDGKFVEDILKEKNIPFYPMSKAPELLPQLNQPTE